jgi:bacteriocin-like protein
MTAPNNAAETSKPIREPMRELTENELEHVAGGIIAILIGLSAPYEPPPPIKPGPPV